MPLLLLLLFTSQLLFTTVYSQCSTNFVALTASGPLNGDGECSGSLNMHNDQTNVCVCPAGCTCASCGTCTMNGLPAYFYPNSAPPQCTCPVTPTNPPATPKPTTTTTTPPTNSQCSTNFVASTASDSINISGSCAGSLNIVNGKANTCVCPAGCTCANCGTCTMNELPAYFYPNSAPPQCTCSTKPPATPGPSTTTTPTPTSPTITNGQCSVTRSSVSPSVCLAPSSCAYQCFTAFKVGIISGIVTLAPSYTPAGCTCYNGFGALSGTTVSGNFSDGSTFSASPTTSDNTIQIITSSSQGVTCTGTYQITTGQCLGVTAQTPPSQLPRGTANTMQASIHVVLVTIAGILLICQAV